MIRDLSTLKIVVIKAPNFDGYEQVTPRIEGKRNYLKWGSGTR